MPPSSRPTDPLADDFSRNDSLLAPLEEHGRNISDLTARIVALENLLKSPQTLAKFFEESTSDSRNLDTVFAKMFCRFMQENKDVEAAMSQFLRENKSAGSALNEKIDLLDRDAFNKTFRRCGGILWQGCLLVAGIAITLLTQWLSKKFGL